MKINKQREKDIKKFGKPRFQKGQLVTTSLTGTQVFTIASTPWCNGFTWMYSFEKDSTMSVGQEYLSKVEPEAVNL